MSWLFQLEFRHPLLLWGVALLPLFYVLSARAPGRLRFSSESLLPRGRPTLRLRLAWLPSGLWSLGVGALVVAAAGPRIGDARTQQRREGIAIMMVVDASGSMRALDLSTNDDEQTRLDAVKKVFARFVAGGGRLQGRPNDAIGLLRFARYADTACPLSFDHDTLLRVASDLAITKEAAEDGTAIGDALALAVDRLKDSPARGKVVILLTDGVNNAGQEDPTLAAELARKLGVKVFTIGVGTTGMAPVRVEDPLSGRTQLRAMPVQIDEALLKDIAGRTGGAYFRAVDEDGLEAVYEKIDRLERADLGAQRYQRYFERYPVFVLAGLLFIALALVLQHTWLRRLP